MRASFFLGLLILLLSACQETQTPAVYLSGETMGTTYHITLIPDNPAFVESVLAADIDEALDRVNQLASTYRSDSDLSLFNQSPLGEWCAVPKPLLHMLQVGFDLNKLSAGAYDITVGPLVDYWGFGAGKEADVRHLPVDVLKQNIEAIKANVGMQYLEVDIANAKARRLRDIEVDLSSIAKGYGVDVVAELLELNGVNRYLVEIGGEVRVKGSNPSNQAWRIGIEMPALGHEGVTQAIALSDEAVATSGDYRNYYEVDGQRISHMIDPRTGYPVQHTLASVTVIDSTTERADGLATMFSVMGFEKALKLANDEGIAVYFIVREANGFASYHSDTFSPYLERLAK